MKRILKTLSLILTCSIGQVNAQPTPIQNLEVIQSSKLNFLNNVNAPTFRPIGVDAQGLIGLNTSFNQVVAVNSKSDIVTLNVPENTHVFTNSGAKYIVFNSSALNNKYNQLYPVDGNVIIAMNNLKFAFLQPRDGGFYIEDFGAIPNDNLDDSDAIQDVDVYNLARDLHSPR